MIILRQKTYSKKNSTVYLLVGLPGSGKSTWCKREHPNLPIISRDIIRAELGYTSGPKEKARLDKWKEDNVTKTEYNYIDKYLNCGKDFIIDDTNLKIKYRKPMIDYLKNKNAYVIGVRFHTPIKICLNKRKNQIDSSEFLNLVSEMDKLEKNEVDKLVDVRYDYIIRKDKNKL